MAAENALDTAARALARRDRSEADLRSILARKGVAADDADAAVDALRRGGALDDARFATTSAEALAARGFGDAAIAHRLEREGVSGELAAEAIAALTPEAERVDSLVRSRGASARTARWLVARGFDGEAITQGLGRIAESDIPELG